MSAQNYQGFVEVSEKISWKLPEVFEGKSFDFSKPFLPESMASVQGLSFLTEAEKVTLNQIRGMTYAHMLKFAEEIFIANSMKQAQVVLHKDSVALRAMLRFAEEEIKHQAVFTKIEDACQAHFGGGLGLLPGWGETAAHVIASASPLAAALVIDALEWEPVRHYLELFKPSSARIDPFYCELFRLHWLEETNHVQRLDGVEIERLADKVSPSDREKAVDEMLALGGALDNVVTSQAKLDVGSLEKAISRKLSDREKEELLDSQFKSYRFVFLASGMTAPGFEKLMKEFSPAGAQKIAGAVKAMAS